MQLPPQFTITSGMLYSGGAMVDLVFAAFEKVLYWSIILLVALATHAVPVRRKGRAAHDCSKSGHHHHSTPRPSRTAIVGGGDSCRRDLECSMRETFPMSDGTVLAAWENGEPRIPRAAVLKHGRMGHATRYAREQLIAANSGLVADMHAIDR